MREKKWGIVCKLGECLSRYASDSPNTNYYSRANYVLGLFARIAVLVSFDFLLVIFFAARASSIGVLPAILIVVLAISALLVVCLEWRRARRIMVFGLLPLYVAAFLIALLQDSSSTISWSDAAIFGGIGAILYFFFFPYFFAEQKQRTCSGRVWTQARSIQHASYDDDDGFFLPTSLEVHTSTKYSDFPGNIHNNDW